jgi:hypothetical protein|tara:strand:- start:548 stop:865 length:318 start_codon:yes stop_codon:yes gene_type:complete
MAKFLGEIILGTKFMSFECSLRDLDKYSGKEREFKVIVEKGLKPFDVNKNIKPSKTNEIIVVVSDEEVMCYQYFKKQEGAPEGYYKNSDFTKWIKSKVGIKKIIK